MIRALITGKLHDTPQARTSATGNTFAIAKVKADDKAGAWVWVSVIGFGAEAERLLELTGAERKAFAAEVGRICLKLREMSSKSDLSNLDKSWLMDIVEKTGQARSTVNNWWSAFCRESAKKTGGARVSTTGKRQASHE